MARPKKEKAFAIACPHTDRVAYAKGMCKSCYNKSKLTAEARSLRLMLVKRLSRLNNTMKIKIEKSAILSVRNTLDIKA